MKLESDDQLDGSGHGIAAIYGSLHIMAIARFRVFHHSLIAIMHTIDPLATSIDDPSLQQEHNTQPRW
jgi:hypothetical protein